MGMSLFPVLFSYICTWISFDTHAKQNLLSILSNPKAYHSTLFENTFLMRFSLSCSPARLPHHPLQTQPHYYRFLFYMSSLPKIYIFLFFASPTLTSATFLEPSKVWHCMFRINSFLNFHFNLPYQT